MISQHIKDIIRKADLSDILSIDDDNDIISSKFIRIRVNDESRADIEMYILGYVYNGKVFFNGVENTFAEQFKETQRLNIKDLLNENSLKMCPDKRILDFLHVHFDLKCVGEYGV